MYGNSGERAGSRGAANKGFGSSLTLHAFTRLIGPSAHEVFDRSVAMAGNVQRTGLTGVLLVRTALLVDAESQLSGRL